MLLALEVLFLFSLLLVFIDSMFTFSFMLLSLVVKLSTLLLLLDGDKTCEDVGEMDPG